LGSSPVERELPQQGVVHQQAERTLHQKSKLDEAVELREKYKDDAELVQLYDEDIATLRAEAAPPPDTLTSLNARLAEVRTRLLELETVKSSDQRTADAEIERYAKKISESRDVSQRTARMEAALLVRPFVTVASRYGIPLSKLVTRFGYEFHRDTTVHRRVSIGVEAGKGAPFAGMGEISPAAVKRVITEAAQLAGVVIEGVSSGRGAYIGVGETAFQVDVFAAGIDKVRDFAAAVGLALGQSEVIISKPRVDGATQGVLLLSDEFSDAAKAESFMAAVRDRLGEDHSIADGYQMVDGGLRIFKGTFDPVKNLVNWIGDWSKSEVSAFQEAVHAEAVARSITVEYEAGRYDVLSEHNDWTTNPAGESFRASLSERGRLDIIGTIASGGPFLRVLPHEVGPAAGAGPQTPPGGLPTG